MRETSKIDAVLREATDLRRVPGVVAMATTDSEVIYEGAFGRRNLGKDQPMTPDSVFWIASMTKAVTGVAAMQLVEQGRLSLDAPIAEVLPELAERQVLDGFAADGKPKLRPPKTAMTLRQLMTHTAGFCYDIWNADMARYVAAAGTPRISSARFDSLSLPLAADPGTRWQYSIGIDFVGKAVEAVSGERLDAYFKDHIFAPLRMNDSGFTLTPEQRTRAASMHARAGDGSLAPVPSAPAAEPEFFSGGGGLYGTAPDYIRFMRMLLNGGALDGKRLLRPETVASMAENHIGDLDVTPLESAIPHLSRDVDFFPGQRAKWGLSFLINTQRTDDGRSPGSLAWGGLANTYFWIDPSRKVAGVIMMQFLPFADEVALELFGRFESGVYGAIGASRASARPARSA